MRADSTLSHDATVTLAVRETDDQEHSLRIRVPAWATAVEVGLHHTPLKGVLKDGTLELTRRWTRSEILTVTYTLATRVLKDARYPGHIAFQHGPWLLGVNEDDSMAFFDEPYQRNRVLVPAATNDLIQLNAAADRFTHRGQFVASVAHLALPYLPGGYPCQPQIVTLRPMAEHTTIGDTTPWVLWFEPKK
jgi:DUF1680 family protein